MALHGTIFPIVSILEGLISYMYTQPMMVLFFTMEERLHLEENTPLLPRLLAIGLIGLVVTQHGPSKELEIFLETME